MLGFGTALQEIAGLVTAAGVPCVIDPTDLGELPGAWVEPASDQGSAIEFDRLGADNYSMTVNLYLLTLDNGMAESYDALAAMLALVRVPLGITAARPALVGLANHGDLPALVCNITYDLSE